MESLEWRTKQLENKVTGNIDIDLLLQVAKLYRDYIDSSGEKYARFKELYEKHKDLLYESTSDSQVGDNVKVDLVLAYEEDLVRHFEKVKTMAETADKVLDIQAWPDLSGFQKRMEKLETITRDQHLQSITLDSRTEELIEIYNDLINSFRGNMVLWNQKLEAYENKERKMDEEE